MIPTQPEKITDIKYRFDSFKNGKSFEGKKNGRLPAMGWNSWNAFGSGNTEALTKIMADSIVSLGLDKLGYSYVVLDDGCYKSERENGKLSNEPVKFPGGFKALSDYIHARGLKFGMYNDIGTNLCAGAAVGTCGFEKTDAKSYLDWGVDFLKIDNCYYLWDNATFSNPENARYVFAPKIKGISIKKTDSQADGKHGASEVQTDSENFKLHFSAADGKIIGKGGENSNSYVCGIGTFDGTNTGTTPVGDMSAELVFEVEVPESGEYELTVEYATDRKNGCGEWLEVAAGRDENAVYFYDDLLPATKSPDEFSQYAIKITLNAGKNEIRLMNHRRQENTLCSYAAMLEGLNEACKNHDVLLSLCEWGKTQPQNWGYKVGSSWRILNDITFRVGSDGNPGFGVWTDPGTPSVTSQYNKAVVMDEFSGLERGWNDPDMLMVGMNGLTPQMNETHFTMWCLLNAPLMLGLDLRRVQKNDELYRIIANADLISLNQDKLGIQAKRIFTTAVLNELPADKAYITDNERVDVLLKPLSDGSFALSFINLSEKESADVSVDIELIKKSLKEIIAFRNQRKAECNCADFDFSGIFAECLKADSFIVKDLWTGTTEECKDGTFNSKVLKGCGNLTLKVSPVL